MKPKRSNKIRPWGLLGLIISVTIGSVAYRIIVLSDYPSSSLMFVGLPALLAVLIAISGQSKSPTIQAFKGTSLFLLLIMILAWEGFVCVLMAAPIFFAVVAVVSWLSERARKRDKLSCLGFIPIALLALEGTGSFPTIERQNTVTIIRYYEIDEIQVTELLERAPVFSKSIPYLFRLGFPVPIESKTEGKFADEKGILHTVRFSGPKEYGNTLQIYAKPYSKNQINFEFTTDSTKISEWLSWERGRLHWVVDENLLMVTLELTYRRNLDPAWYFSPLQNYAVQLAGNYLLESWIRE